MEAGLTRNRWSPGRLVGRALQGLLILWAVVSVLACASPEAGQDGGTLTDTARLEATEPRPVITLAPLATLTRGATAAPTATLTSTETAAPTPTLTDTPAPSGTAPLSGTAQPGPAVYSYRIINVYPHDSGAYTQGLVYEDGLLYEGTGIWGQSTLRKGILETGEILQNYSLPEAYFGEGITIWQDRIIQLTWKAGMGFVYDREGFDLLDSFDYATEGWGITHDGSNLIMSDGTATLHIWDPETFEEVGQIQVQDAQGPVVWLNELEYVQGKIYANVYQTDRVAMIEPETGQVTGWIDLGGLLDGTELLQPVDVLNGIAYDAENDRLFVTGKWWPKLFEIELVPVGGSTD